MKARKLWVSLAVTFTVAACQSAPTPAGPTTTVLQTVTVTAATSSTSAVLLYDHLKVEKRVGSMLVEAKPKGFGLSRVSKLSCPERQPVIVGTIFKCTLLLNGAPKTLAIRVEDAKGKYQVAPPK